MKIYEYKEMLENEGERHTIRNMKESCLSNEEITELLEDGE
jgi:arsenate reductase-like glutaredoxin family protein